MLSTEGVLRQIGWQDSMRSATEVHVVWPSGLLSAVHITLCH